MSLTIALNPVPASRPRVTKWGVHYQKTYATWKKQALHHLPHGGPIFGDKHVAVLVEHIIKKPKTTKRTNPRGDTDNYLKASLDACTKCKGVWTDDDIVVLTIASKRFTEGDEEPRTEILIIEL